MAGVLPSAQPGSAPTRGQLARLGFEDTTKAVGLLGSDVLAPWRSLDHFVTSFHAAASPDLALLAVTRIAEAARSQSSANWAAINTVVADRESMENLVRVVGASEALGEHLVRHPADVVVLELARTVVEADPETLRTELVTAMTNAWKATGDWNAAAEAMRVGYRRRILQLAALDLAGRIEFEIVTATLSVLADAVLEASLTLARTQVSSESAPARLAVIAMGKCGGRELNYVSDVDVIFVAEPSNPGIDDAAALATATAWAKELMRAANASTAEGSIWEVDAALRPEGKAGALVRTVASHLGYYQRWAKTWEFQALLKARGAAGDEVLAREYIDSTRSMVWSAASRPNFVADVQQMRARVESIAESQAGDRELKLGRGGLRDVEFSVQLLQLVHGRDDERLRSANTIEALTAMADAGYVGRSDADTLRAAYVFLRTLEHRMQLHRLQRVHVIPEDESALRRLGRAMGFVEQPVAELKAALSAHRIAVRRLHEKLFYRPLLNAVASMEPGQLQLTREAAGERLTALGFTDPAGALRHLEALTEGVSRRASIQRTLLPVMFGWFADAPNPDAGLLAFRRVSDALGSTPWFLRLLRDESESAWRLAKILSSSRFSADLLIRAPEAVAMLGEDRQLRPRSYDLIRSEMRMTSSRHSHPEAAIEAVRTVRRKELFRISSADILGLATTAEVSGALCVVADATVQSAVEVAAADYEARTGDLAPCRFAVLALGRLGGHELGYTSDADVMFVHDPLPGHTVEEATRAANDIASTARRVLAKPGADPPLDLDSDLRPEGRSGPMVRSIASYRAYYQRWSSPWEAQALLRARTLAGDVGLLEAFFEFVDPIRWPPAGISAADLREVRRLKARMEAERLPRGADPRRHLKLGPGGLSDVEWTVQLLQMQHAGGPEGAALRTTSTLDALAGLQDMGLLTPAQATDLRDAWMLATQLRNAIFLATGKPTDEIPKVLDDLAAVGYLLGFGSAGAQELLETYSRTARHARTVFEDVFYGPAADDSGADSD